MAEKEKKEKKEGSKGNILKIVIIILLLLVLVAGGTAAGYIFATKTNGTQPSSNTTETTKATNVKTFSLDEFLVNLKEEDSSGYLKTNIYIGFVDDKQNKKLPTELEDKKPILRDCVNTVLRNKKPSDFNEAGVEQLRKEIKDKINPVLQNGQIENVYFYDIIVQAQ